MGGVIKGNRILSNPIIAMLLGALAAAFLLFVVMPPLFWAFNQIPMQPLKDAARAWWDYWSLRP